MIPRVGRAELFGYIEGLRRRKRNLYACLFVPNFELPLELI
jgi:hypothetical protein